MLALRAFLIALVAKLSKAPLISTDMTKQNLSLRIKLSIIFTSVDRACLIFYHSHLHVPLGTIQQLVRLF